MVFTPLPQMGIYSQLVWHLLAFLSGGRHVREQVLCSGGENGRTWMLWKEEPQVSQPWSRRGGRSYPGWSQKMRTLVFSSRKPNES